MRRSRTAATRHSLCSAQFERDLRSLSVNSDGLDLVHSGRAQSHRGVERDAC